MLIATLVVILLTYIVVYNYKLLTYWKRKGVKYVQPLPFVGNSLPVLSGKKNLNEFVIDLYRRYPDERYCGIYQYGQPILMLRDLDLIKRIFAKEFRAFPDHPTSANAQDDDPFWGRNLFAASGERWKNLRQTLSPFFTVSKTKSMFTLMDEIVKHLLDHLKEQDCDVIEVELKGLYKKYATDFIASLAFGINLNSFKDADNEFIKMGVELTSFSGINRLRRMLYTINPYIRKLLNLKMHPDNVGRFFRTLIKDTISYRTANGISRPDLIQFLLDTRKGTVHEASQDSNETQFSVVSESDLGSKNKKFSTELTDDDITAQGLDFFYGGSYSTPSLITFCSHELAFHPEIQDKLRREIDGTTKENGGKISYELLTRMKYLDMVVSETLRKWSTATWVDRICREPVIIEPERPGETSLHIDRGTIVWIPAMAIHRDPHYWPEPEKFDPERFSDKNKNNVNTGAFLAFGGGPRNCIGSRLAILQAKLVIFYLLSSYEIIPTSRSGSGTNQLIMSDSPFWFGLKRR
nr:unnamed protein product [Callosobruchus chinensis]